MNERYWLFNTDETEAEGVGASRHMINLNVIAAWGNCRGTGAQGTLDKPTEGETVFFFLAGEGIIASGTVCGPSYPATSIFGQTDEYHREVANLRILSAPLTVADIRTNSGYDLPCRHIVCQLNHEDGVRYIQSQFANVPVA